MTAETEIVRVTGVGPFSIFSGSNKYQYGKGIDKGMFTKGHTYSITFNVGSKGTKYINTVSDTGFVADVPTAPLLDSKVNQAPTFVVPSKNPSRAGFGQPLTDYDMQVQHDIHRSGLIQACVQAVSQHCHKAEDIGPTAIKLAEEVSKWVKENHNA